MSNPTTLSDVQNATNDFFKLHWNIKGINPPEWSGKYSFKGGVPNQEKQGCYALLKNDKVMYIGLGSSRGGGIYKKWGIGTRIINHVIKWDRVSGPPVQDRVFELREPWKDITDIHTIGFPSRYGYLASALESFLISELKPVRNVTRTS